MIALILMLLGVLVYCWKFEDKIGLTNIGYLASIGIIFTASLDLGIIMLPPITDNSALAESIGIEHHHALEMSLWAGLIWLMYLVWIFYFKYIESRFHFIEYKWSKILFAVATFLTYAFSIQLFNDTLPSFTSIQPLIFIIASLVIAIYMYAFPKHKLVITKLMIPAILLLPVIAIIDGAAYDSSAVLSLPEAQWKVWLHQDDPDVHFFLWWWIIWGPCTARYLYSTVTQTRVWKLGLMVILVPLMLVIPWISVDMTLEQITSSPFLLWYILVLATLFLSSSIVAMMHTTNEIFAMSKKLDKYKSYLSVGCLLAITAVIYMVYIELEFIAAIYVLSIMVGFIYYIKSKFTKKS